MRLLPFGRKNSGDVDGHPTGQNTPVSKVFCQESLTKSVVWVENREDNSSPNFMGKFGKLAGAMAFAGSLAATEAVASDKTETSTETPIPVTATVDETEAQVTDCVAYVKEERAAQKAKGIAMSRKDQKLLLLDCRGGILEARIEEQEAILADLGARMAEELTEKYGITLDADANVVDEYGKVLARIVAINGQLVLQRQLDEKIAEQEQTISDQLDEAERIVREMLSS